jgi:uncharacterized protein
MTARAILLVCFALSLLVTSTSCIHFLPRFQSRNCVSRQALLDLKLILAAKQGRVEIMRETINAGADVNVKDDLFGNPLVAAAAGGNPDAVKLLLESGANVNASDGDGYTALMRAVMNEDAALVRELLARGAAPNARHTKLAGNPTALTLAKSKQNETIVKLLIDAGAIE